MCSIAARIGETSCARARRAHSLVLDSESDAADLDALAAHLARCGACFRAGRVREIAARRVSRQ